MTSLFLVVLAALSAAPFTAPNGRDINYGGNSSEGCSGGGAGEKVPPGDWTEGNCTKERDDLSGSHEGFVINHPDATTKSLLGADENGDPGKFADEMEERKKGWRYLHLRRFRAELKFF